MIAPNVILIWTGAGGSVTGSKSNIPAGFTRVTDLDAKFIKGTADATNPNTTGGATTHTHTSSAHSHTMDDHYHNVTLGHITGDGNDSDSGGSELTCNHSHSPNIYGTSGGALSSVTSTYGSVSNNPPYYDVIFIQSGGYNFVPDDVIGLWNGSSLPTGFKDCDGNNSTVNLTDKFLHGAAASTDAGATGGSTTNIHALTHTHTESAHSHAAWIYEAGAVDGGGRRGSGSDGRARLVHHHYVSLNSNSAGSISSVSLTTSETVQPPYRKLECIQNTSGAAVLPPKGLIGLWLGTLATIPAGWFLCDGNNGTPDMRGKYLKVAVNYGQNGDTGGATTHTHASQNHTHTGGSHTHTSSTTEDNLRHNQGGDSGANGVGGGWGVMNKDHSHWGGGGVTTINANTVSWAAAATTGDSSSNEPEYRTVAYIQFQYGAGGSILNLIL